MRQQNKTKAPAPEMLPVDTFTHRVVIVTGGGSGIGAGIALELIRLGAKVILVGRTEEKLRWVQQEGEKLRSGSAAVVAPLNVRDRDAVAELVTDVVSTHGKIDHLVNSAAGNFRVAPEDMSPNAWDAVVKIVQYGTWNFTQLVGKHMIDRGEGGSILSIGTIGAVQGGPDTVHSASAKAAVATMSKSLAAAWGTHGIRSNVLIPGMTAETPGVDILYGEADLSGMIPLGRLGTKTELAHAATFLLSDYASYITGAELIVDGGRALRRR